jgi:hypothetical protein
VYHSIGSQRLFAGSGGTHNYIYTGTTTLNFVNGADTSTLMTILNGGSVGIGTTSPLSKLDVRGAIWANYGVNGLGYVQTNGSDSDLQITIATNLTTLMNTGGSAGLAFGSGNSERMRILSGGSIGIGTTSPAHKLEVYNSANSATYVRINNQNSGASAYTGVDLQSYGGGWQVRVPASTIFANSLQFSFNDAEKARITYDGNLGIGVTSPTSRLHISSSSAADEVILGTVGSDQIVGGRTGGSFGISTKSTSNGNLILTANSAMYLRTGGSNDRLFIKSDGNVGIGTTSPAYKLDINGVTRFQDVIRLKNAGWNLTDDGQVRFYFDVSGRTYFGSGNGYEWRSQADAALMVLTNAGNVGVGTTSPITKFDVRSGYITTGTGTSTSGTIMMGGYYGDGNLTILGTEYSSGGPVLGYGVTPSTTSAGAFLSSTGVNVYRSAYVQDGGTHRWYIGGVQTVAIGSAVSTSERMRINADGNLGIGTSSPRQILHLNGSILLDGATNGYEQGATRGIGYGTNNGVISSDGFSGMDIQSVNAPAPYGGNYSQNVRFWAHHYGTGTGNTPRMVIQYNGSIGIGTTAPATLLQLGTGSPTTSAFGIQFGDDTTARFYRGNAGMIKTLAALEVGSYFYTTGYVNAGSGEYYPGAYGNTFKMFVSNVAQTSWINGIAIVPGGNVGIGTTTSTAKLEIFANVAAASTPSSTLTLSNASDGGHRILFKSSTGNLVAIDGDITSSGGGTDDGVFKVSTSANGSLSEKMRIISDGNVGIGTTAPGGKLEVRTNAASTYIFSGTSTSGYTTSFTMDDTASYIGHDSPARSLTLRTNSTDRLSITGGGNIGIGTSSPSYKLDVNGESNFNGVIRVGTVAVLNEVSNGNDIYANIRVIRNRSSTNADGMYVNYDSTGTTAAHLRFYANGQNERMRIDASTGNVGIGTTSPADKLEIDGGVRIRGGNSLTLRNANNDSSAAIYNAGGAGSLIYLAVGPSPTMTIGSNVGIGTTSPANKLQVVGDIGFSGGTSTRMLVSYTNLTDNEDWQNSPISIRERDLVGNAQSADKYGPNINFHWANRVSYSLWVNANGILNWGDYSAGGVPAADGTFRLATLLSTSNIGIGTSTLESGCVATIRASNTARVSITDGTTRAHLWPTGGHFYFSTETASDLIIITNSNERIRITSGGNVGIGTTSPASLLQVGGSSGATATPTAITFDNTYRNAVGGNTSLKFYFYRNGGETYGFGLNNASGIEYHAGSSGGSTANHAFYTETTEKVRINSAGNLGIGTTAPGALLNIRASAPTGTGTVTTGTNVLIDSNTNNYITFRNTADNGTYAGLIFLDNNIGGYVTFGNSGAAVGSDSMIYGSFQDHIFQNGYVNETLYNRTETMRIKQNGYVGINTNNPTGRLHIVQGNSGGVAAILLSSDESTIQGPSANTQIRMGSNLVLNASGIIPIGTNGSERMRIQSDGNVGIGTTSPSGKLHVIGEAITFKNGSDSQTTHFYIANAANTRAYNLQLNSAGTNLTLWGYNSSNAWQNLVNFNYNGNVGIGTTSPLAQLHAASTTSGATLLRADGTSGTLFSVVDDLTDSLMSVNNSAGLPVFEVFADDRVVAGQYGANDFVVRNNRVGIGTNNPLAELHVTASASIPAAVFIGDVGIGTTAPTAQANYRFLQVNAPTSAVIEAVVAGSRIGGFDSTSNILYVGSIGSFPVVFRTAVDEKMRITANGNIGIGTSSPNSKLTIVGDGTQNNVSGVLRITDTGSSKWGSIGLPDVQTTTSGANNYYLIGRGAALTDRVLSIHIPNAADYGTGAQPKFGVYSTGSDLLASIEASTGTSYFKGNVGIGITSNLQPLSVGNSSANTFGLLRTGVSAVAGNTGPSINFYLSQNATTSLTGDANLARILANPIDGWGGYLQFFTKQNDGVPGNSPVVRMTIDTAGNVGIGSSSPTQKLDVAGSIYTSGKLVQRSATQSLSGTTGCTIDLANGAVHILSLANATTISSFTYNSRDNNPSVNTLMLVFKYAGTASVTFTNVIWANGVAPTLTGTNGFADVFMLTSYQGGAGTPVWIGTVVAQALVSTNL